MRAKKDRVTSDTCLKITDAGRKRLRQMEHRPVLRAMMGQLVMADAVFSILNRMQNGDIMTVKQLIDFRDKEAEPDFRMIMLPRAIFVREKAVSSWAINRCVRRGYLAKVPAVGSPENTEGSVTTRMPEQVSH